MSRNKKDLFKEIISQATPEKPADDMADLVMQQITTATDEDVAINPALKRLLQQHASNAAPMTFTQNIMKQINPQQAALNYQPIISKKGWYAIAVCLLCALVIAGLLSNTHRQGLSSSIARNAIKQINALPAVYIITLTLGGLLLLLEHLITTRLKLTKQ